MTKKVWIILAIVLVLIVALSIGGVVLVIKLANKTKDPITASTFESKMTEQGLVVVNSREQLVGYDYIKDAIIAIQKDRDYQIEFYIMDDVSNAQLFFNNNKSIFENSASNSGNVKVYNSFKNNEIFKLSSNGKYMVVSRIDNTVIYVKVDIEYKDAIDKILENLGY